MPYVQRTNGEVTGIYANAQPGYAEEWLAVDSPDLIITPPIPASCTPLQCDLALHQAGLLEAVDAAIAGADVPTQLARARATSVDRNSSYVQSMKAVLGLTDAQLDDLFILAATFV